MKKNLIFIWCLLSFAIVIAQRSEPIITDRPTQSAASSVMSVGKVLVEYGFASEKTSPSIDNTIFANIHARMGLIEGLELRITQNYLQQKIGGNNIKGLSPAALGVKAALLEEKGIIPEMSVIGQVTFKTGKEEFRPARAVPEIRLNCSNTLSEYLSIGYNVGVGLPEDNAYFLYTLVLGYSFYPNWTIFVEPYGFLFDTASDHRFNGGFIYLVSDRFQLDVSGGLGISDIAPDSFIGFGAAYGF